MAKKTAKKKKRKIPTTRGMTAAQRKKTEAATRGKGAFTRFAKKKARRAAETVKGAARLVGSGVAGAQLGFQGPRVARGAPTPKKKPPREVGPFAPELVIGKAPAKKKKKKKAKKKAKRR